MASFTRLDDAAIAAATKHFRIGEAQSFCPIAGGTINSNFQITCGGERYFLRVNEGKSRQQVEYEIAILEHWAGHGVAAPLPLRGRDGLRYFVYQGHLISVFPWSPGHHVGSRCIEPGHCEALGAVLAKLHTVGCSAPHRLLKGTRYSDSHLRELYESFVDTRDPALSHAVQIIGEEFQFLEGCVGARQTLETGLIHADLFPDNVLLQGDEVASLLDFEQACAGAFLYDLAVSINAWCFATSLVSERAEAMLRGYCLARAISAPDPEVLRVELRASALRFTITRITDVYLRGEDAPNKDFRRFLMRLEHWRAPAPSLWA